MVGQPAAFFQPIDWTPPPIQGSLRSALIDTMVFAVSVARYIGRRPPLWHSLRRPPGTHRVVSLFPSNCPSLLPSPIQVEQTLRSGEAQVLLFDDTHTVFKECVDKIALALRHGGRPPPVPPGQSEPSQAHPFAPRHVPTPPPHPTPGAPRDPSPPSPATGPCGAPGYRTAPWEEETVHSRASLGVILRHVVRVPTGCPGHRCCSAFRRRWLRYTC